MSDAMPSENNESLDRTAEALSELADLLQDFDVHSAQITAFLRAHRDVPEFTTLADEAVRLADTARAGSARSLTPSRLQKIGSLAASLAGIGIVLFVIGLTAYLANEARSLKRELEKAMLDSQRKLVDAHATFYEMIGNKYDWRGESSASYDTKETAQVALQEINKQADIAILRKIALAPDASESEEKRAVQSVYLLADVYVFDSVKNRGAYDALLAIKRDAEANHRQEIFNATKKCLENLPEPAPLVEVRR
jgi:hypothetical protein